MPPQEPFLCWRPANAPILPGPDQSFHIDRRMPRQRQVESIRHTAGWLGSICRDFGLNVRVNRTGRSPPARRPLPRDACWGRTADGGHRQWSVVLRQSDPSHPPYGTHVFTRNSLKELCSRREVPTPSSVARPFRVHLCADGFCAPGDVLKTPAPRQHARAAHVTSVWQSFRRIIYGSLNGGAASRQRKISMSVI